MKNLGSIFSAMRASLFPTAEEKAIAQGTPGERHRYALQNLCASNPRRNACRKLFRRLRSEGVRVRRPADLRPHFAVLFAQLSERLTKPVVVEHEGTVQP